MILPSSRIRALVIAHDARATGGVNNFLRIMRVRYRSRIFALRFSNGKRNGENGKFQALVRLLYDYIRFSILILRKKFDVLHINPSLDHKSTPRELLFVWIASLFDCSVKILVFYRGWDWSAIETLKKSKLKRRLFLATHAKIDRVLVLSSSFKESLVDLGVPEDKIFLGTTMFEGAELEKVVHFDPPDRRSILFLCRFLPAKGGLPLLQAFSRLHHQFPDWKLVMAGDGPQREELEAWVKQFGLSERVVFTGYVGGQTKMRLLMESAIFALPTSHPEGMPNAILEAMAAGQVIITTGVGGIPDIVKDGAGGRIIDYPEADSIESALFEYMNDSTLISKVGKYNKETAWKNWESSIVSGRIADHYADIKSA